MRRFLVFGISSVLTLSMSAALVEGSCMKAVSALHKAPQASALSEEIPYKVFLSEDFSLFTNGSEAAPATATVNDAMQAIPSTKTHTSGWQGREIHEAGGMAYQGEQGVLFTPDINLSANGGEFRVSVRMKLAPGSKSGVAHVQHGRVSSQYSVVLTEEWQTVVYNFTGGVVDDYVAVRAVDPTNAAGSTVKAYIDDFMIEVPNPSVTSPTGVVYDNFDGTSFSVYWHAVSGADSYELSLYTLSGSGVRKDIEGDFTTTDTEYTFDCLDENWSEYVVSVRARKGDEVSPYSTPLAIEGLPTPEIITPTVGDTEFTASWQPVQGAYGYEMRTFEEHTATDDERFYYAETSFDFVKEVNQPSTVDVGFSEMPGWFFGGAEFQDGYIGIQGAFAMLGYAAQIESPTLDLSANGGKVTISFRVKNDDIKTGVVVCLYVRERGDYRLADEYLVSDLTKNWRTITCSLTGGTDNSIVAIIPTSTGNLYVDDLKVFQNVKPGMTLSRLAAIGQTVGRQATVKGITCPDGDSVYYIIRTIGINAAGTQWIYSPFSERVYVKGQSGLTDAVADSINVTKGGGILQISNPECLPVALYTLSGMKMLESSEAYITFTPTSKGIYLLRTPTRTLKIII